MNFSDKTSKNVHDFWKVCLETTLCVLVCLVYMFILNEIDVWCPKLVYKHIQVGYVRENIPKDHPRVLEEGLMLVAKTTQGSPTYELQLMAHGLIDSP